jgi:hypothetical protein
MKVKELIELLQREDPERLVVVSRDAEGNGFSVLGGVERSRFDTKERQSGIDTLTPELAKQGFGPEDVMEGPNVVRSVTLWP